MKKLLFTYCLVLIMCYVQAQKRQNVYYLNQKGKEVKTQEEADFVRVIQEPDSGERYFKLYEFYMNNKRKAEGRVSAFENRLAYEGLLVNYDRNGVKRSAVNYKNGFMLGNGYYYFGNGKLQKQVEYIAQPEVKNQMGSLNKISPLVKLFFMQDSLGVVAVKDGNGHVIEKQELVKQPLQKRAIIKMDLKMAFGKQ